MKTYSFLLSSMLVVTLIISGVYLAIGGNGEFMKGAVASGEGEEELDVGDVNVVPLQETGPPDERLNLVLLGDGYTVDEMDQFHEDVDRNQNYQWSVEPFRSYRNHFNVYMVETPSVDSGISCDPDDENVERDTVYNLWFPGPCPADELERLISYGPGGDEIRDDILEEHVAPELGISPDAQNVQTLILANTFTYGGQGGIHATTSGGGPQGPLVSVHELGHSLGELQDEYSHADRGEPGGTHPDEEPDSIHHTRMSSEEMIEKEAKWWRWLGEESESGGIIRGADPDGHEGGLYEVENVWRPSEHSAMRWIGNHFDQVSREYMTQQITGMRDATEMPLPSTPEGEVGSEDVVWVEPLNPRFHAVNATWEINGEEVSDTNNSRRLELSELDVEEGDTVKVTVQDQTEFVRDPEYLESPAMTQTREWTVGEPLSDVDVDNVEFINSSPTDRAMANDEVVYVETPNPNDRILDVTWELNGEEISETENSRILELDNQELPEGTSELSATLTDPEDPEGESDKIEWTVDNGLPEAPRTLSEPLTTLSDGDEHNVYFNEFDMSLEPEDDQPGHVVGEFRLNENGWFNYFGFPEESTDAPFTFSHAGTNIKEIVYGNLGTGGLTKAPYEQSYTEDDPGGPFVPGFGTHTVEHRAIDAAGNIGEADEFQATVLPGESPECTETVSGDHNGSLVVTEGVTCLEDADVNGGVTVQEDASLVAFDSTINGGLDADHANEVQMFGTSVNGSSTIDGTERDVTFAGNEFHGSLTLSDNQQVSANEQYGEYGPILVSNTVNGSLACEGNNAPVTDFEAQNEITGPNTGQCANIGTSATGMQSLVEEFNDEGAFADDEAPHSLLRHLEAIAHYENQGEADIVVQHMEGFKDLLDHQIDNDLISEETFDDLYAQANELIEKWE